MRGGLRQCSLPRQAAACWWTVKATDVHRFAGAVAEMKSGVLLLALGCALDRSAEAVELDPEGFGDLLPSAGAAPLLLFLSRPGCSVCEQLEEKWDGIAEGVGSLATLVMLNCDPEKGDTERFCFAMQSAVRGHAQQSAAPPAR